jgi:hypothetical protein
VTWVSWRLQRTETLVVLGTLVLIAALLVPTGIQMTNAYDHDGLAACLAINTDPTCSQEIGNFHERFQALTTLGNWFTLMPGLIGVLLAAPFIIDLEQGTYRLAWTQSITRGRWLAGKLALPLATAVLVSAALSVLFTWWRTPNIHLNGRLDPGSYDTTGTVGVGYALFALALAVALGAVWRRAAVSLTVAFVGYFAARIFVDYWLRDHLVAPLEATYKGASQPAFLHNAHVISLEGTVNGHQIGSGGGFFGSHVQVAAPDIGNAVFHVVYQPESRFWTLQLAETGLFVGLAVILLVFAAWWTHERTT